MKNLCFRRSDITRSGDITGLCWNKRGNSGPLPDGIGTGATNLPHHPTVLEEVERPLRTEHSPAPSPPTVRTGSTAMFHQRALLEQGRQPCSISAYCWNRENNTAPSSHAVGTGKTTLLHQRTLLEQGKQPCSISAHCWNRENNPVPSAHTVGCMVLVFIHAGEPLTNMYWSGSVKPAVIRMRGCS